MKKTCSVCNQLKSLDNFYNYNQSKDGKSYRCKSCDGLARRKWRENNPENAKLSQRRRNWRYRYGLSSTEYDKMLKTQGGGCAICSSLDPHGPKGGSWLKHFAVDHCHSSNKVRGLLCNRCNRALGLFQDSLKVLENALEYLKKDVYETTD